MNYLGGTVMIKNVNLSKQQKEIVNYEGEELLIRGIAGSGKSLILFKKAEATARKYPNRKIAIFTYNRSLAQASKKLAERLNIDNMYVNTFHSWANAVYRKTMKKRNFRIISYKDKFLEESLKSFENTDLKSHRFIKEANKYQSFIKEEIAWIKGRGLKDLESYQKASRRGRGSEVRVTKKDREVIYRIFNEYNRRKGEVLDYDDLGFELFFNIDKINDRDKFDHIFVDEGQDLQQVQLFILRNIARKSFFIAADIGQKIYKTSFTWKDIGLNISGGRTKVLKDSFRSTKQIVQLANSLQEKDSIVNDEEFVSATLPKREGPVPLLVECSSYQEQMSEVIESLKQIVEGNKKRTVGILIRERKGVDIVSKRLKSLGIPHDNLLTKDGDPYTPGIKLSTIHSSKGLQFDFVLIINLVEPKLGSEIDLEEYWNMMRRLLYVGITRATTMVNLYYYGKPMKILHDLNEDFYDKVVL